MRITYKGLRSGKNRCTIITYAENEENKAYEIAHKFTIATSYKVDDMNDFNNDTDSTNNTIKAEINLLYGIDSINNDTTVTNGTIIEVLNKIEILLKLKKIFNTAEKYKNSYTWNHDNGNKTQREQREKQDSINLFEWYENGDKYTAEYTVKISRYNVYAYGTYTKNGMKTTLTAIKNSYKRLLQAVQRE